MLPHPNLRVRFAQMCKSVAIVYVIPVEHCVAPLPDRIAPHALKHSVSKLRLLETERSPSIALQTQLQISVRAAKGVEPLPRVGVHHPMCNLGSVTPATPSL